MFHKHTCKQRSKSHTLPCFCSLPNTRMYRLQPPTWSPWTVGRGGVVFWCRGTVNSSDQSSNRQLYYCTL